MFFYYSVKFNLIMSLRLGLFMSLLFDNLKFLFLLDFSMLINLVVIISLMFSWLILIMIVSTLK